MTAANALTMSPGRVGAILAGLIGLIGVVTGSRALVRSSRVGSPRGAITALVLGPIGFAIGGLVVATADGGIGTGNGLGGGIVAMVLGLLGIALGGLARTRTRRTAGAAARPR